MNIRTSAFRSLATLSLIALGLAACDKKDVIVQPPQNPTTVTVSPGSLTLGVGQTGTLVAVVANNTNTAVNWTSSNAAVATVSATGVVTAVAPGSTTIIATSVADANARDAVEVTVTTSAISITLAPATATVAPGGTIQLVTTVNGTNNTGVTYRSSATGVATVNATGLVTAVAPGTAIITAISAADTTRKAVATINVSSANLQVSVTPTVASVGVGGSQQFVATVSGTGVTNTAVTWRSSSEAIATIDANGVATGRAQGTTVITAISVQDTMARATATLTVLGASVAIAVVPEGVQVGPLPFIVQTNVAIPAGAADSLMMRLINVNDTTLRYTWRCQTFTAAGAATQVHCPINPADFDPYTAGVQILPNGTYTLQAVLIRDDVVADLAVWGTPITTNYSNTITGVVTFDNSLVDDDNAADDAMATSGGDVWFGGKATVKLTPALFTGGTLGEVDVAVDVGCDGTEEAVQTVEFGTDGTGTATFEEDEDLADDGIDDLSSDDVCFTVAGSGLNTDNIAVPIVTGLGNVVVNVALATNPALGSGQNLFRIDNVEPAAAGAALSFDAADFDGNTGATGLEVFLGTTSSVTATGTNPTVLNASGADAGVMGVTYIFYAVPAADYDATDLAASAEAGTVFTSPSTLAETLNDTDYVLVVEARDALGNRRFAGGPRFGVDLTAPTIAVDAANSPANNSVNPTDITIRFAVTDAISGAEGLIGSTKGHSVFEYDADSGVEVRCYNFDGSFYRVESGMAGGGTCTPRRVSTSVAVVGGTEYYEVTIPVTPVVDENFYVFSVQSIDAANNVSTTTITYNALIDITAGPAAGMGNAVTVNNYTIDNVAGTATVNGVLKDNIEIRDYDSRFRFVGLMAGATNVPDEVPFSAPVTVGTYGLPLTAEVTVSATSGSIVDGISDVVTDVAADYTPSQFGFGMKDLASNYTFGFIGFSGGSFDGFPTTFTCAAIVGPPAYSACGLVYTTSAATIDRTPSGASGAPLLSTTMTATITTETGAADPLKTVYFYYVDPGVDLIYNSDPTEHNVLVAAVAAPTTPTSTTEQRRIFTATSTLTATNLPPNVAGFQFQTFAIGVAADGDAIITPVVLVAVNN